MQNMMIMPESASPGQFGSERKIRGYKRHELDLDERNLKSYRIRRMDAKILKFSKNPYPGGDVEDKHLRILGTIMQSSKRLQNADLNLWDCKKITQRGLKQVQKGLRRLTWLRNLTLDFSYDQELLKKGMKGLTSTLKSLSSLQDVDLRFGGCYIQNQELFHLKALKKLRLTSLKLDFLYCYFDDTGMRQLGDTLKNITRLQNIDIAFRDCRNITNKGVENFGLALKTLTYLKMLNLDFGYCLIDSVCKDWENSSSLQSLALHFSANPWFDKIGCYELGQALKKVTNLKALCLNFERCSEICDEAVTMIMGDIGSLTGLKSLDLHLWKCEKVTHRALVNLGRGLKACSFSLESIKLSLSIFVGTTPEDLAEFTQGFAKHTGLKDLSLPCFEFDRNHNVVDSLKELIYLQSLNLNYQTNTICDLGLESLSQSLSKLILLQNLSLKSRNNRSITDEGLESLVFALRNLTDLKKLELDFSLCRSITDEGIKGLILAFVEI